MGRIGIVFDIDHTLVIDNKLERVAFLHLLEDVIADGGRALGPLAREIDAIDELLVQQRSGGCSIDDAVRAFVRDRGVAPHQSYVERFRAKALHMVEDFVVPATDAQSTLTELDARGYAVAVLTNGWNPLQRRKAERAGFTGFVLASSDMGLQKPDPRVFRAAAAELGIEPASVWYVGDDPCSDVVGALGAGLRAIWLDNEGGAYPAGVPEPTARITALADVLVLLPAPIPAS
ncbi:MAG: HAD family hydrolase [Vulcanimicrobiaceae bacterium]